MKFAFVTMPAKAHLNPTLGVAKELMKRGHTVIIYTAPEFSPEIQRIGAQVRTPIKHLPNFHAAIGKDSLSLVEFLLQTAATLINPLSSQIAADQPDCVVHDSLNVWGKIAAAKTNIPTVCLVPTFVLTPKLLLTSVKYLFADAVGVVSHPLRVFHLIQKFRALYLQEGLRPPGISDVVSNKEKLNVVFTSRYFQPDSQALGNDYQFVGPIMYDRQEKNHLHLEKVAQPIVYISLGTIYNEQLAFYKKWLAFFKNSPYQVYISIGKHIEKKKLGDIPENVVVDQYLPQLEILKRAAGFISHGGMNSVNESLYFGVPMLLFPQIHEQKINSARVEKLGAGIWYQKKALDHKSMSEALTTLMTNGSYKQNAKKIGQTLQAAGGIKTTVNVLLKYLQ